MLRGYFYTITIAFFAKRHVKNSCNRNFNTIKKLYYKVNVFTKDETLEILEENEYVAMINTTKEFFKNLGEL